MNSRYVLLISACCLAITSCQGASPRKSSAALIVSAAADLVPAFEEIGKRFEQRGYGRVIFNFGSTGQLAQQIEQGAPADVFAAANISFVEELEARGLIIPGTNTVYARGRITIWSRKEGREFTRLEDLAGPDVTRIAIANPEHAPYGVAAREALEAAKVWPLVSSRLVFGENIRQTLQYAETGNVDAAIMALSLSIGSTGKWTLIPESLHTPLNQALAIIKTTRKEAAARQFVALVQGEGREVMRRYGFLLPGEDPVP